MILYYLLLGHLLGDFVLQTDTIAGNKGKYPYWNALHAFLVTLCIFALAIPSGPVTLALVILNGAAHFFIDFYRPILVKSFKMSELTGFLADQILHIILLYLVSFTALPDTDGFLQRHLQMVKLLLAAVFVTSFAAVLNQFLLGAAFPRTGSGFFGRGEKRIGIVIRLYISIVLYLSITISPYMLLLLLFAAPVLAPVYRRVWSSWMSGGQLAFKLVLDLFVCVAGVCLLFRP